MRMMIGHSEVDPGDKAMILLQSLICYLREKNVLSRADIEELRERVEARIPETEASLPCVASLAAAAAATEMRELDAYCGKKSRSQENTYELQSLMSIPYDGYCLKKKT